MSEKKTLVADEILTERTLSRRQMALLGGAATGALAALGLVSTTACCMGGGSTGSGCSDSDPTDGVGRGTHCAGGAVSGCSDSDPSDPAGNGSHCAGGAAVGCSDSDPTDPAGHGSHCGAAGT